MQICLFYLKCNLFLFQFNLKSQKDKFTPPKEKKIIRKKKTNYFLHTNLNYNKKKNFYNLIY